MVEHNFGKVVTRVRSSYEAPLIIMYLLTDLDNKLVIRTTAADLLRRYSWLDSLDTMTVGEVYFSRTAQIIITRLSLDIDPSICASIG